MPYLGGGTITLKSGTGMCCGHDSLFVSPELSSGRDLVIQMSVRRPPSVIFCPEYISGTVWPTLMIFGMWVGARVEVAHAEFWVWHIPIKYLICIICAKSCPEHFSGTVCPTWMIFGMWIGLGPKVRMVTFMEVKWGKLCAMATIFGLKKSWCKQRLMMTVMEVKGHQRSMG